jgi:hypothetical protein
MVCLVYITVGTLPWVRSKTIQKHVLEIVFGLVKKTFDRALGLLKKILHELSVCWKNCWNSFGCLTIEYALGLLEKQSKTCWDYWETVEKALGLWKLLNVFLGCWRLLKKLWVCWKSCGKHFGSVWKIDEKAFGHCGKALDLLKRLLTLFRVR